MFRTSFRQYSTRVMDYSKFISKRSARRKSNLIRQMSGIYMANPDLIPFAGGLPNTETFPFQEIDVTYKDGTRHKLTGKDLDVALQYGHTEGYPPLMKLWRDLQNRWHSPPRDDWEVLVTTGSQEACSRILEHFLDEGDAVMVQVPAYTGTLGALDPLAPEFIGIEQDAEGIVPDKIRQVCEARMRDGLPKPKLLSVNPTGSNPTGAVLSEERRREVYALAQKYDFLILEDDAYYFVNFLEHRPTSFFSMDTDGRVMRVDSFSKILSAGIRIGILTAHKDVIRQITMHITSGTLHTSSLSQMLVYKLLNTWGPDRFEQHLGEVQSFYRKKRDMMVSLVEKHLTGLAEWSVPQGGMFIWIKVKSIDNVFDLVMEQFVANGVLVLPGHAFNKDIKDPDQHVRLSYSYASPEKVDKGLSIMARLIKEHIRKNNVQGQ
ncbi:kynurenine/alpha-aminoadipate aminotransferase, mitochondrial-like isoform X1 [Neodiprion virginianus]|uniref:kynurenine/alpha-aminoadipate aminotransferase, mitochondrial-like isoform X1 n=2 Tax=Neodiprion virginianus TaxID=2961670 RepID=UPI001EE6E58E|nr:kynurenine/alpha-aminoadipate aminotransferase, mitochondrial-like isoform X1 [Neodiprion virginianus]